MWEESLIPVPRERLLKEAACSDGLLTMLSDQIDEALLAASPRLKVVANLAVGYDNIDIEACKKHGVSACNTPDVLTDTTADLAFGLLLATARRIPEAAELVKTGEWHEWGPYLMAGKDVHHKTLGIVGMGRIGSAVAKRARGFDMEIVYHNRSRSLYEDEIGARYVSFETLLKTADYVLCLAPLTKETKHLFNAEAFRMMKKDAIFINVGRGGSVDEEALTRALVTGEIAGAGLDVFKKEPIDADHPLLALKQVVALPHIGSASKETRDRMAALALENIHAVLVKGEQPKTPIF